MGLCRISLKWKFFLTVVCARIYLISSQCTIRATHLSCDGRKSDMNLFFPQIPPTNLIREISIVYTNLTNLQHGNITLPNFPNLTKLRLYSNGIRVVNPALVVNNQKIQSLSLQKNRLSAVPVDVLEKLTNLRYLDLGGLRNSEVQLASIKRNTGS